MTRNTAPCRAFAALTLLVLSLAPAAAQDVMHYRFDESCGSEVVNHATGSTVGNGTITATLPGAPVASWTDGRFGRALAGVPTTSVRNYLTTGWTPGSYSGPFTVSFWIRNRVNPASVGFGYMFATTGGNFRLFTGTSGILFLGGWGGSPSNIQNATNLTSLLGAGWTHVACTVDPTTAQGIWYVNGVPDVTRTLSGTVNLGTGTNFTLGAWNNGSALPLDMDEFLFTTRALSAPEVQALAASGYAGDGTFGTTCGPLLDGNGQRPFLGNTAYALNLTTPATGLAWLVFGSSRCTMGAGTIPLPIDLGILLPPLTGCQGHVDIDIGTLTTVVGGGGTTVPFPVPVLGWLDGYTAYCQAVVYDATTQGLASSNALSIALGGL